MSSEKISCPEFDLTGKVAVVTGAGRGMGRYMALDLARYGADVVLCSRTKAELEEVGAEIEAMGTDCARGPRRCVPGSRDRADDDGGRGTLR